MVNEATKHERNSFGGQILRGERRNKTINAESEVANDNNYSIEKKIIFIIPFLSFPHP